MAGLIGGLFAVRALRSLCSLRVPSTTPELAVVLPGLLLVAMAAAWIPSGRPPRGTDVGAPSRIT